MELFIPTYKRVFQETYSNLPVSLQPLTKMVVNWEEPSPLPARQTVRCPEWVKGIGMTRQYVCDLVDGPLIMMDDDLTFAMRRIDDPTKFAEAEPIEIIGAFQALWISLTQYAHVGMATREGGNRMTESFNYNTRLLRVLGYRSDYLKAENIRFDGMKVMEDFDVCLALLTRGYPNCQLNWMVHNQKSSNAPGGCSTYRTLEVQGEAARALAEKYPRFVSTIVKQTKTAWNGKERTDVIVQWKKAFASAGRTVVLDQGKVQDILEQGGSPAEALESRPSVSNDVLLQRPPGE